GNYPVPVLLSEVACCHNRLFDAGVVKCKVQSPESFNSLVQGRLHIVGLGHVTSDSECAGALLIDQARCFLITLFANVGNDHACTSAGKGQCSRPPNTAACSSDKAHFAGEASVVVNRSSHI